MSGSYYLANLSNIVNLNLAIAVNVVYQCI